MLTLTDRGWLNLLSSVHLFTVKSKCGEFHQGENTTRNTTGCGDSQVVKFTRCYGGFVVELWWSCGDGVANSTNRFVRLVVILGLVLVAIFVAMIIVNSTRQYQAIFTTFMNS